VVNDLELLTIQAEGAFDQRGRVAGWYGVTIACSADEQALWIGADVPDALATELAATVDPAPVPMVPAQPPRALDRCRRLLDRGGRALPCSAGPSFLIEAASRLRSGLHIERSDASRGDALRNANPGNWHPAEWGELLDGCLGPWAMAIEDGLVVSICHTPVPVTGRGAECGVWTHPSFRGRGYGAAVVSEWAGILRPSGRYLFYSTHSDNLSSQRLARRMQLRPLGWTWRFGHARRDEDDGVHPLCTLRRRRGTA
jgi:ribosomal protein S18 acetylase RimI-like enzyme